MKLHYSEIGEGKTIVILHGLYGSGNNWMNIARKLSKNYRIVLFDMRNHGLSAHTPMHNYDEMANDLKEMCNTLSLNSFYLIGHSMGGKTAMTFTLKFPGIVEKLVVVDISPFSYLESEYFKNQIQLHHTILKLFNDAPIHATDSRSEIEEFFDKKIKDLETRKFLLKNLKRNNEGEFYWQLNIEAISKNFEFILDVITPVKFGARSSIPTLFLRGEKSNYLPNEDISAISDVFTNSKFEMFENAGHWLHFQYPDKFIICVSEFFS